MAMGRPVVATPQAFAGLRATPGRDLLVADGAEAFAAACAAALNGRDAAAALGRAAREAVLRHYAWDATLAGLDALVGVPAALLPHEALT
jgi:polysaccharide biosynthesis protein PslH